MVKYYCYMTVMSSCGVKNILPSRDQITAHRGHKQAP